MTDAGLTTDEFPVFRVDEGGRIAKACRLITLEADESVWLPDEAVIDGLPPETHLRGEFGEPELQRTAFLDAFGARIANTDRHLFNIALFPIENGYSIAPVFDQLPMAYAPPASGQKSARACYG